MNDIITKVRNEILFPLKKKSVNAIIFGGFPRDVKLGKPYNDIDILVNKKDKDIAYKLFKGPSKYSVKCGISSHNNKVYVVNYPSGGVIKYKPVGTSTGRWSSKDVNFAAEPRHDHTLTINELPNHTHNMTTILQNKIDEIIKEKMKNSIFAPLSSKDSTSYSFWIGKNKDKPKTNIIRWSDHKDNYKHMSDETKITESDYIKYKNWNVNIVLVDFDCNNLHNVHLVVGNGLCMCGITALDSYYADIFYKDVKDQQMTLTRTDWNLEKSKEHWKKLQSKYPWPMRISD